MNKIPHRYNKFDKMSYSELAEYIKFTYGYYAYLTEGGVIEVYTYFGRQVVKGDSKKMIIFWLDFEKNVLKR